LILLDTHALIWAIQNRKELGANSKALIEQAQRAKVAFVASITPWEMSMLVDKGRLELGRPLRDWIDTALKLPGIRLAALEPSIAIDAGSLPGDIHGDPSDRIIIATARWLGCPLLTADRRILRYAEEGHVEVIDAAH
jgi:PIN domain nuclease of toxin-antitoxin system